MADGISYEEHVQLNNQRLSLLRSSLTELHTFANSCQELTKWCSDQRAFSPCFEDNLMSALQVAIENGTKEGFDFNLAHQLISACFSHRKLLSKNSATRINRWYEQFRRLKKNGGKRKKKNEVATVQSVPVQDPCLIDDSTSSMWSNPSMPGSSGMQMSQWQPGAEASMHMPYPGMQQYPMIESSSTGANFEQQRMMMMRRRPGGHQEAMMMVQNGRYPMTSPAYPQPASHQMIRAGPPMVYGQVPQHQQQQVVSYPNPNLLPDNLPPFNDFPVCVPEKKLLVDVPLDQPIKSMEFEITTEIMQLLQQPTSELILTAYVPNIHQTQQEERNSRIHFVLNNQNAYMTGALKSIALKQYVMPGKNVLQFQYTTRFFMHRICLEVMTRKSFLEIRQRLMTCNQNEAVQKSRMKMMQIARTIGNSVTISLLCSSSKKRMVTPARHSNCTVSSCFDLPVILTQGGANLRHYCSFCYRWFSLSDVEVDFFVGSLLHEFRMQPQITEVSIDANGAYKAVEPTKPEPKGKKRTNDESNTHTIKRIKSESFANRMGMDGVPMTHQPPFSPMGMMPASVPNMNNFGQSPALMSPCNKAPVVLGPPTPATPSMANYNNPLSVGSRTSPKTTALQSQNSVEQMNIHHGSAPYTPSSIGCSTTSSLGNQNDKNNQDSSLLNNSLNIDLVELYSTGDMPLVDNYESIKRYLQDCALNFDDIKFADEDQLTKDTWDDVHSIIIADK